MTEATIRMLRARQDERVAMAGVIAGLFCDDLPEALRRLEAVRDAARQCERQMGRKDREGRRTVRGVAECAEDLLGPVRQIVERAA